MAATTRHVFGRLLSKHNFGALTRLSTCQLTEIGLCSPCQVLPVQAPCCPLVRKRSTDLSQKEDGSRVSALQMKEEDFTRVISENINSVATEDRVGRLFAVIYINGRQRKITTEDIIIVEGQFPPDIGDRIKLEKVLLVGSKDFTAIGRPMLNRNQTTIEATVIEKTLETTKPFYTYKRKQNFSLFKLYRQDLAMLRINKIEFHGV
ncbi:large ribosomal subunit protein bL21m-like [Lineus longissimus]|uniref:large ribosomal subunit protein bL21m-like n=1 Tax=Lineus longissimus TaxID=88925 RepID=UPI002B4DD440